MNQQTTVLITGGSSGLGLEMAGQMLQTGAAVIICGRSVKRLEEAAAQYPGLSTIRCDISVKEDRQHLAEEISRNFSGLNMLVNNAGFARSFLFSTNENLETDLRDEWETNYLGTLLLTRKLLPVLEDNRGTVVNVTSGLAYIPLRIKPNYCATKAALHSMTQSLRLELAPLGIRVREIAYPAVDTPFQQGHSPAHAITAELAVKEAIKGLRRGQDEIRVKMAGTLRTLSRLMPGKAIKIINGMITEEWEASMTPSA